MTYALSQTKQLLEALAQARATGEALAEAFLLHPFADGTAQEYARHGFVRRIHTLVRALARVFEVLPPDVAGIPERDTVLDATINVQAFVFNTFGCLDNLAWVWVCERGVKSRKGRALRASQVGLGPDAEDVRASFSPGFRTYLDGFEPWFRHVEDFRHALAHRIPLYIPPHTIPTNLEAEYNRLEAAAAAAISTGDRAIYFRSRSEQFRLGVFQPMILHSLGQNSATIWLHPQLLTDFNTVEDIAQRFLSELRGSATP
jgi:hypothetical protein